MALRGFNLWIPTIMLTISLGGIVAGLAITSYQTKETKTNFSIHCTNEEVYKDKLTDVLTDMKIASAKETKAIENLEKEIKYLRMERRK